MNLRFEMEFGFPHLFRQGLIGGMAIVYTEFGKRLRTRLSQAGTGRIYKVARGNRKGRNLRERGYHRASSPGAPPAALTGYLRASWSPKIIGAYFAQNVDNELGYVFVENKPSAVMIEFGSKLPYAAFLEYGTRTMQKRPYIAPTMSLFESEIPMIMATHMKRVLR